MYPCIELTKFLFRCIFLLITSQGIYMVLHNNDIKVKAICTHTSSTPLHIECRNNSLILLKHAFFGKSRRNKCHHTEDDCYLIDVNPYESCNKRIHCQLIIDPVKMPNCKIASSSTQAIINSDYYQIVYECIHKATILNVCQVSKSSLQSGLVVSPNISNNMGSIHQNTTEICQMTIDLSNSFQSSQKVTQNILVVIIDMKLDCSSSYLQLSDLTGKLWKSCKLTRHSHVFTTVSNILFITYKFNPSKSTGTRGFWLSYKASPFIIYPDIDFLKNACKNAIFLSTFPSEEKRKIGKYDLSYLDKDKTMEKLIEVSNFNHIVLMSVLIAILVTLLTVLLSVVLIKRYKICFNTNTQNVNQVISTLQKINLNPELVPTQTVENKNQNKIKVRNFQCHNHLYNKDSTNYIQLGLEPCRNCPMCSNSPKLPIGIFPNHSIVFPHLTDTYATSEV